MNKKAFTLVELIVVITILAILGTIGFMSMQGYAQSARESTRISDLTNIKKTLFLFHTRENFFPDPSSPISITFSGSLAWKQGEFGDETRAVVGRITESPKDPLTDNLYAYSVTNTSQEFELGSISETQLSSTESIISPTYATNNYFVNIEGNYNKQIVTVKDANTLYILGVPTLITSEITNVTVQDIIANGTFSVKNSKSLPASYVNTLPIDQTLTDGISFIPGSISLLAPLIYDGSIDDLNDDSEKQVFADNLVSYYQGSNLDNLDRIDLKNVISGNELSYINTLIQNNTGGIPGDNITVNVIPKSTYSCKDPTNIGSVGVSGVCDGLLIVDRTLLESIIAHDENETNPPVTVSGVEYNTYLPNGVYTGQITNMNVIMRDTDTFNYDIGYWDMSSVTTMRYMLLYALSFDRDIKDWDVSNVTDMEGVFYGATRFNQDISDWCVSSFASQPDWFSYQNQYWTDKANKLPDWGDCP